MKLLTRAKEEGRIKIAEPVFANLQSSFSEIEDCNRKLLSYGWVNFPLAYTQVICSPRIAIDNYDSLRLKFYFISSLYIPFLLIRILGGAPRSFYLFWGLFVQPTVLDTT